MVPLNVEAELRRLLQTKLPAVKTAGCRFSPVQGLSGESWRIDGDGVRLLARQQTSDKTCLGVSRHREAQLLRRCARTLGPRVVAQNAQWIIVEWLSGEVVTHDKFACLQHNGELAELMATLHQSPLSGYRLVPSQHYARYWQHLDRRRISPAWLRLHQRFLQIPPPQPLKLAPLHMDIHPDNLIAQGQRLRLIDWEYATDGDVALELAAMFRFNAWQARQQQCFIRQYAQTGYHDPELLATQVSRWLPWVDYLMLMWFEVRWQQTGDRDFLSWAATLRQRFCIS
ncbi:thiamine kinase [Serratia sp. NPDC078593]|uniref:thiamine kinase n=1 Tax=unclassified Serratia (in: enterobacteria) TaxID=2647522 RepID=UPI0037D6EC8B